MNIPSFQLIEILKDNFDREVNQKRSRPIANDLYHSFQRLFHPEQTEVLYVFDKHIMSSDVAHEMAEALFCGCRKFCEEHDFELEMETGNVLVFKGEIIDNKLRNKLVLLFRKRRSELCRASFAE